MLKVSISIVLLILTTFIIAITGPDSAEWGYGWPLHFLEVKETQIETISSWNFLFLIADIIFWYLVVQLLAFLSTKFKQ